MDYEFYFKLILTLSFGIVSLAFAIKLLMEAYLWYVQVMTGVSIAIDEHMGEEEEEDERQ